MKAQSQWCPVFICSYSDWSWQLQSENTATKLWFLDWKVTNRAPCKSSGATWFVCMKEFAELEPILSGVGLPRGRVCFNVAALRSGSKAQQRWKPGKQVSRGSWGTDGVVCHSLLKAKWWRSLMVPCFQQRDLRPSAEKQVREWGTRNQNEGPRSPACLLGRVYRPVSQSITMCPGGALPPRYGQKQQHLHKFATTLEHPGNTKVFFIARQTPSGVGIQRLCDAMSQ